MPPDLLEPKEKSDNIGQRHSDDLFNSSGNARSSDLNKAERGQENLSRPDLTRDDLGAVELKPAATSSEQSAEKSRGFFRQTNQPKSGKAQNILARARGLSTGKKVAAAGIGSGLMGIFVLLVMFMLFASGFGIENLARVLRDSAYAGMHLTNYRRTSQYFIQASLEDAAVKGGGRLNQLGKPTIYERLRGYDPTKSLTNLGKEGRLSFDFEGVKSNWRPGSTTKLTSVTVEGRTIPAPEGGLNPLTRYKQHRDFVKGVESAINSSDLFAEQSRFIRTRTGRDIAEAAGVKLYGWENRGRKIKNFADSVRSMHERVRGTSTDSVIPEVNQAADEVDEKLANATPEEFAGEADDFITRTEVSAIDEVAGRQPGGSLGSGVRNISLVNFAGTLYCSAYDYTTKQDDIVQMKIEQSKRSAALLQSSADQIKTGDTTGPAVDGSARRYAGFEESYAYQSSVGTAPPVLAAKSPDLEEDDLPKADTSSPVYLFFSAIRNVVEGPSPAGVDFTPLVASRACPIVLQPNVQIGLAVVEVVATAIASVVTLGGAGAAEQGGRIALQEGVELTFKSIASRMARTVGTEGSKQLGAYMVMSYLFGKLAGTDSPALSSNKQATATIKMGTDMLANDQALAMGGRELSTQETVALHKLERDTRLAMQHEKSLFYRLASLQNPYSPATQLAIRYPINLDEAKSETKTLALNALNPLSTLSTSSQKVASAVSISPQATFAAEVDDILKNPVKKIGFSVEEMNKMLEDSYWPGDNGDKLEEDTGDNSYNLRDLDEKYGKCFTPLGVEGVSISERDGDCSEDKLKADDAFRYRLYRLDGGLGEAKPENSGDKEGLLGQLIDLQDVQASETSSGDTETVGDPLAEDSSGTPCAEGTRNLGTTEDIGEDAYTKGKRIKVRLCALTMTSSSAESISGSPYYVEGANGNAIVNSVASGPWQRLINAAVSAGIPISASSSWRTMRHQQDLCDANPGCSSGSYNAVAKPGTSNHQAGSAIDIEEAGFGQGADRGRNCSNPQTVSSATYNWLASNAKSFGIKQYANESWHWGLTEAC